MQISAEALCEISPARTCCDQFSTAQRRSPPLRRGDNIMGETTEIPASQTLCRAKPIAWRQAPLQA
jgi:hypothetical protein